MKVMRSGHFVASESDLELRHLAARQQRCDHCGRVGTLNGHGFVRGYGLGGHAGQVRGRRLYCSNRGTRPGCGRTRMIWLRAVIPGFIARTLTLWQVLSAIASGQSLRSLWRSSPGDFALRSVYRWRACLREALPHLRSRLLQSCDPPASKSRDPLTQLHQHFCRAFPFAENPACAFQDAQSTSLLCR